MAENDPPIGARCCTPPTPGLRMLSFPDGTRAGVCGLSEIFAAAYREGRPADAETAQEMVERLSADNYVAPSARQQYCDVVIEEYRKYVESRQGSGRAHGESPVPLPGKPSLLSGLFRNRRRGRSGT